MMNHVYCLLVNRRIAPSASPESLSMPEDFAPVSLSGPLQEMRTVLFGREPDESMLQWRAVQYLSVLEAVGIDLAQWLNSRSTYDGRRLRTLLWNDPRTRGPLVTAGSQTSIRLEVTAEERRQARLRAAETGMTKHCWNVEPLDSTNVRASISKPVMATTTIEAPLEGQLSRPFVLPHSSFSIRVGGTPGDWWDIEDTLFPLLDVAQLLDRAERASPEALAAVFQETRPAAAAEEDERLRQAARAFHAVWRFKDGEDLPRLGALLAAWVLALETQRRMP